MANRRGSYGIDAPLVPIMFAGGVVVAGAGVVATLVSGGSVGSVLGPAIPLVLFAVVLAIYMHSTLRGKFVVWEKLLDESDLDPSTRALDLGCGRGAVLFAVAKRLGSGGCAEGIDLWRGVDQSGNAIEITLENAEAEGVADEVKLHTGDLRSLPFDNDSFDVVVSSMAIHNIKSDSGRDLAAAEALRVLQPGGRLMMVDMRAGRRYLELLEGQLEDSRLHGAGWRMWWGWPFYGSIVLTGTKPA